VGEVLLAARLASTPVFNQHVNFATSRSITASPPRNALLSAATAPVFDAAPFQALFRDPELAGGASRPRRQQLHDSVVVPSPRGRELRASARRRADRPTQTWEIARADEIVGFDPAAVAIFPSQMASDRPEFAGGRFFVTADNQSLSLNYAIPEPGSLTLVGALAVVCASGCRRRRRAA
jgi:hypothetical protein